MKHSIKKYIDFFYKVSLQKTFYMFELIYILSLGFFKRKSFNKQKYLDIHKQLKLNYKTSLPKEIDSQFKIDRKFILDLALPTQVTIKLSKINIDHGKILYSLLRNYLSKNKINRINILEVGTAKGFSSLCMAKALYDHKIDGNIFSFDILDHKKKRLWNSISDFGNPYGISRNQLIEKWHYLSDRYCIFITGLSHLIIEKIHIPRINFAFLDGSHYGHDIKFEFSKIVKYQQKGDIVFFDDYNKDKFPDLVKSIDDLLSKYKYEKLIIKGEDNRNYILSKKN